MIMAAHYGPVQPGAAGPQWHIAVTADGANQSLAPDDFWPLPDASAVFVRQLFSASVLTIFGISHVTPSRPHVTAIRRV